MDDVCFSIRTRGDAVEDQHDAYQHVYHGKVKYFPTLFKLISLFHSELQYRSNLVFKRTVMMCTDKNSLESLM